MSEPWERRDSGKEQQRNSVPFYIKAIVAGAILAGALQVEVKTCVIKVKNILGRVKRKKRAVE